MTNRLKIGQDVLIHGYIDEIRKDTVIIRNEGGYFGTVKEEISGNPQEHCEDAISRQAVLEYIEGSEAELGHSSENELVCQDIKELPPVIPHLKTGHWIDREIYDADRWKCSECGRTEPYKENYCPNCGAKMEGQKNE